MALDFELLEESTKLHLQPLSPEAVNDFHDRDYRKRKPTIAFQVSFGGSPHCNVTAAENLGKDIGVQQ
jgi:hypothetical protein